MIGVSNSMTVVFAVEKLRLLRKLRMKAMRVVKRAVMMLTVLSIVAAGIPTRTATLLLTAAALFAATLPVSTASFAARSADDTFAVAAEARERKLEATSAAR